MRSAANRSDLVRLSNHKFVVDFSSSSAHVSFSLVCWFSERLSAAMAPVSDVLTGLCYHVESIKAVLLEIDVFAEYRRSATCSAVLAGVTQMLKSYFCQTWIAISKIQCH